jgi:hypothetical protein
MKTERRGASEQYHCLNKELRNIRKSTDMASNVSERIWSSCHSCPLVSPPTFPVRAHLVLLVSRKRIWNASQNTNNDRRVSTVLRWLRLSNSLQFKIIVTCDLSTWFTAELKYTYAMNSYKSCPGTFNRVFDWLSRRHIKKDRHSSSSRPLLCPRTQASVAGRRTVACKYNKIKIHSQR